MQEEEILFIKYAKRIGLDRAQDLLGGFQIWNAADSKEDEILLSIGNAVKGLAPIHIPVERQASKTKIVREKIMAYLTEHGPTKRYDLMIAMELETKFERTFIRNSMGSKIFKYKDIKSNKGVWSLATEQTNLFAEAPI